jgi:hypothetical protein
MLLKSTVWATALAVMKKVNSTPQQRDANGLDTETPLED